MGLLSNIVNAYAKDLEMQVNYQMFQEANAFNAREAQKQRDWSSQEAQLAYERTLSADSTKYQRQVADLQAAGLNPMLAVSNGAGSVQSSPGSSQAASSVAPLRANLGDLIEANLRQKELDIQESLADSQIKKTNAEIDKIDAETGSINLDNEIKSATKQATIEAAELDNQLTRSKRVQIDKELDEIDARISKMASETKTESDKQALLQAQSLFARANASQVVALLPYQKMLMEAQTEEARNAAALAAAHTAYQNHLINDGYIDAFISNMRSEASSAESKAELDAIKAGLRTGDYSKVKGIKSDSVGSHFVQLFTISLDNLNPLNSVFK